MSNARNIAALSTVEVGATADQTKADLNAIGVSGGRKNLIINGEIQVSQRGSYTSAVTMTNGSYYQDRWTAVIGVTASTQTKSTDQPNSQTGKSIRVLASSASSAHQCAIDQRVENPEWLAGRVITFSVWMKSNTNKASLGHYNNQDSFVTPTSHTGGGAWEKLTLTHTVHATGPTDFRMRLGMSQSGNTPISSGDYFEVTEAQLELGSVATDFEHRSYGETLALCQRYCIVRGAVNAVYTGASTGISQYFVDLPQTMKSTPTVIVYGIGGYPSSANNYDKDGVGNVSVNVAPKRYGFTVYNLSGSGQFGYKAEAEL